MSVYEEFSASAKNSPLVKLAASLLIISCFLSFLTLIVVCVLFHKVQDGATVTASLQRAVKDIECTTMTTENPVQDDTLTTFEEAARSVLHLVNTSIQNQGRKFDIITGYLERMDGLLNWTGEVINSHGNKIDVLSFHIQEASDFLKHSNETLKTEGGQIEEILESLRAIVRFLGD